MPKVGVYPCPEFDGHLALFLFPAYPWVSGPEETVQLANRPTFHLPQILLLTNPPHLDLEEAKITGICFLNFHAELDPLRFIGEGQREDSPLASFVLPVWERNTFSTWHRTRSIGYQGIWEIGLQPGCIIGQFIIVPLIHIVWVLGRSNVEALQRFW